MGYIHVKNYRKRLKQWSVDNMGGKCRKCGYSRCIEALEFHHIDPSEKDFTPSQNTNISHERMRSELQKCIMLCAICHREYHAGIIRIEDIEPIWLNIPYKEDNAQQDNCPVCDTLKSVKFKFCSQQCSSINRGKVDWSSIDLERELSHKNMNQLSVELGVSWNAVKKRALKLGLVDS